MKLTYKDFKEGQILTCIKLKCDGYNGGDIGDERLIIGEEYTVTDVDFHWPDRVCIKLKGPYYFHEEFVPIKCFGDTSYIRNERIKKILE